MAHNKGLELGADMVLLLVGGGVRTEIMLKELELVKGSYS